MIAELAGKRGAIGADNANAVHSDVTNFPFSGYLLQTVVYLQTRFCVHINMRWQTFIDEYKSGIGEQLWSLAGTA